MTETKRIVATDMSLPEAITSRIEAAGGGRWSIRSLDGLQAAERKNVEVLVIAKSALVTRALFDELPGVRFLQSLSAGVDFIDFSAVPERVTVSSNAGAFSDPIAEHVFAMALYFAKRLVPNHERMKGGTFGGWTEGLFLRDRTIGIVGAGGIGQSVARVARAFRMRTLGMNTSGRAVEGFDEVWRMDRLDELLRKSDIVVISLPLSRRTRSLIDARRLSLMKEDCILINVARGPIIDQAALYSHLKSHPGFRAGIDVWWRYPKKDERFSLDFPFFDLPNFLASPHNADGVPEALALGQEHAFENVLRYLEGGVPGRVVDKADYVGLWPPADR